MSYSEFAPGPEGDAVRAMIGVVEQYAREHTPPLGSMPEGIRLEMHPSIHSMIRRNWLPMYAGPVDPARENPVPPQVPVVITPLLERDCWRLVVVTEDVITGGRLA